METTGNVIRLDYGSLSWYVPAATEYGVHMYCTVGCFTDAPDCLSPKDAGPQLENSRNLSGFPLVFLVVDLLIVQ